MIALSLTASCAQVSGSDPAFWDPAADLGGADAALELPPPPAGAGGRVSDSGPPPVATPPPPGTVGCSLVFTATTVSAGGRYAPNNVGAVWITDAAGRFVKTLSWWGLIRLRNATSWYAASGGNTVDAVSGATRPEHGPIEAAWDCTGLDGTPVADGRYVVHVTFAEANAVPVFGPAPIEAAVEIEKGPGPIDVAGVDTASFVDMRVVSD